LVGTTSIETSERLAKLLAGAKIPHEVLNAKQHEREAHIVARRADRARSPSPPTWPDAEPTSCWAAVRRHKSMHRESQRVGTESIQVDWRKRHEEVVAAGGLHIIAPSATNQGASTTSSGAVPDARATRFEPFLFVARRQSDAHLRRSDAHEGADDARRHESRRAIESGMLTRQIERAQRRVEQHNFDARKQLLNTTTWRTTSAASSTNSAPIS